MKKNINVTIPWWSTSTAAELREMLKDIPDDAVVGIHTHIDKDTPWNPYTYSVSAKWSEE